MEGWKIGSLASFGLVSIIYGAIILYKISTDKASSAMFVLQLLKTYPIMLLIFVPVGIIAGLVFSAFKFLFKKSPRRKKGDIWVSTVLYTAIGIISITLILSAGLPVINKMKERNTILESKILMHAIEESVYTVVNEGLGSKRVLDPVIIKGGKLIIEDNKIRWEMKTSAMLMEPCPPNDKSTCSNSALVQREGMLDFYLLKTIVEDEYLVVLELDYSLRDLKLDLTNSPVKSPLTGSYMIVVSNDKVTSTEITVGIYIT